MAQADCEWIWLGPGLRWGVVSQACPVGQSCQEPNFDGTVIGQRETTTCEGP